MSEEEKHNRVHIGLEEIVAELESKSNPQISATLIEDTDPQKLSKNIEDSTKSTLKELIENNSWEELLQLAEKRLAAKTDPKSSKLAWCIAEYNLGRIPSDILEAPSLEAIENSTRNLNELDSESQNEINYLIDYLKKYLINYKQISSNSPKSERIVLDKPIFLSKETLKNPDSKSYNIILISFISVGLIFISAYIYKNYTSLNPLITDIGLFTKQDISSSNTESKTQLPVLDKSTSIGGLDTLYYEMEETEKASAKNDQNSLVKDETRKQESENKENNQENKTSTKEIVNTKGPIEDRKPKESIKPPEEKKPPESVESLFYRVEYTTKVFERPDIRSRPVGELQRGAIVAAEKAVGDWLKIRSTKGRIGFIDSRDAVFEPDYGRQ